MDSTQTVTADVTDAQERQPIVNEVNDTSAALEEIRKSQEELRGKYDSLQKDYTRATQEAAELRKSNSSATQTNSYQPQSNINDAQVQDAIRILKERGVATNESAEEIAKKVASEIASSSLNEYRLQADLDNFAKTHNSEAKSKEVAISDEDKSKMLDYCKSGMSMQSALYAIKGQEIVKAATNAQQSYTGKRVSTVNPNMEIGLGGKVEIKKEDITKEKFDDNFTKFWDATH